VAAVALSRPLPVERISVADADQSVGDVGKRRGEEWRQTQGRHLSSQENNEKTQKGLSATPIWICLASLLGAESPATRLLYRILLNRNRRRYPRQDANLMISSFPRHHRRPRRCIHAESLDAGIDRRFADIGFVAVLSLCANHETIA
jgi:hypothetical protein